MLGKERRISDPYRSKGGNKGVEDFTYVGISEKAN